jgi:S1-C subfamily serine protease
VQPTPYVPTEATLEEIANKAQTAVVALNITLEDAHGKEALFTASGFLVSPEHIVTTHHGMEGGKLKSIMILWDSRMEYPSLEALPVLDDPEHDLTVLKLSRRVPYPFFQLDEKRAQKLGEPLAVFGFPEVTQPEDENVKYLHMVHGLLASYQPASPLGTPQLILDARVLRGNSGGPVISLKNGRVVGVVSEVIFDIDDEEADESDKSKKQTVGGESLGIAISAEVLKKILQKL